MDILNTIAKVCNLYKPINKNFNTYSWYTYGFGVCLVNTIFINNIVKVCKYFELIDDIFIDTFINPYWAICYIMYKLTFLMILLSGYYNYNNSQIKIEFCKKSDKLCKYNNHINSYIKITHFNVFGKENSKYCGYCYSVEDIMLKYNYIVDILEIYNISVIEIKNITTNRLSISNCKLLKSINNINNVFNIEIINCRLLQKVYNIPTIEYIRYLRLFYCNSLTEFSNLDNKLTALDEISKRSSYSTQYTRINHCNWLPYNAIGIDWDYPLAVKIKKLTRIQRLYKWRTIKKILYKKIHNNIVDFVIRKYYI
jgi:metal-sulfur cluster biosynthetic enzyme